MSANLFHLVLALDFSKRTCDPEEKARLLAKQSNLHIMYEKEYFETSAMYMMIVTKHKMNRYAAYLKRCMNHVLYKEKV